MEWFLNRKEGALMRSFILARASALAIVASPAFAAEDQETKVAQGAAEDIAVTGDGASFPPSATLCHKCSTKALVIMDGCATCLNCGYSKCG